MDIAAAKARIRLFAQTNVEPTLSDQEITDILTVYALEDADGLPPSDVAWVGTWDLSLAIRQAWLVKAAKVAPDVNYSVDGAQYSQSDLYAHCMAQADKYGSVGTISIGVPE